MTDDALAQEAEAGAVVHLPTHHGRRLSQNALRGELDRAARAAGLGHVVPHQLRHTHATAMANAVVSLQALMAYVTPSWRYLFGTFVQRSASVNANYTDTAAATYSAAQLQDLIDQVATLSSVVGQK